MDSGNSKKRKINDNIERAAAADRLYSKKRKKEKGVDRLSRLPDDLIHKILSFISIKDTAKTSVLSSRYRFIWTTMPYLNISTEDFLNMRKFYNFITLFLKRHNSQIGVSCLNLSFRGSATQPYVRKLLDYAYSHNVQRLDVKYLLESGTAFPFSLFSSGQSLKHISLKCERKTRYWGDSFYLEASSTLELPALTTLYLKDVFFRDDQTDNCVGLLSKCPNLENLTLDNCGTKGLSSFSICHPGLKNLTLDEGIGGYLGGLKVVNVDAPQLENLTIRRCNNYSGSYEHVISAPNLASLAYRGHNPLQLSTHGFRCLKEADICIIRSRVDDAHQMICLLQQLRNVRSLKLNMEMVEVLSSSVELISFQPSPFVNLKSLTIYPEQLSYVPNGEVDLSSEVKNYLLDSSPGAIFTMFSREEFSAMKNAKLAQNLMTSLQRLLKQEKAKIETNGADMEQWRTPWRSLMENCPEEDRAELENELQMIHFNSCWDDMSVQIKKGKEKTCGIISSLLKIQDVMIKLPSSKRAEMQAWFSSLRAEADAVVDKIMDRGTLKCNMRRSHFSACFKEIVSKLPPSL